MADSSNSFGIRKNIHFLKKNRLFRFSNLFVASLFLLVGLYAKIGGGKRGHTVSALFADFFSETYPLYGIFTSASDILWCVAASICWFTYSNLHRHSAGEVYKRFILWSAIILTLFLVDDLFRLTLILQVYLSVPKLISYVMYGASVVLYGWTYRKLFLVMPYSLLIAAAGLLVISGITDMLELPGQGTPAILEDGTKLMAVLNICIFFFTVCQRAFSEILSAVKE